MTTEPDEALVERVADAIHVCVSGQSYAATLRIVRDAAYMPAPPKTRLQVARELWAGYCTNEFSRTSVERGYHDGDGAMFAIIAALALPAMED